jgi:hypothetical protein
MAVIERWACPQHPGEKVKFNGGALWCLSCRRALPDAIKVVVVPAADWEGAVVAFEDFIAEVAAPTGRLRLAKHDEGRLLYEAVKSARSKLARLRSRQD